MERVTFLVERTGERIVCLLNPESLEVRRSAGVVRRRHSGGALIGALRSDDPLVATGGGTTDYELHLLFDVDLVPRGQDSPGGDVMPAPATLSEAGSGTALTALAEDQVVNTGAEPLPTPALPRRPVDVRSLTQPLWSLAENGEPVGGSIAPQRVRFIWGRSWNVPGVILAVAERHDRFNGEGVPQRSWLSLMFRRVEEEVGGAGGAPPPTSPQFEINPLPSSGEMDGESITVPVDGEGVPLAPLYLFAAERCGDARHVRAFAEYNDLDDMLELDEGRPLRLPPPSALGVLEA